MKVYSAGGQALSAMPDVTALQMVGTTFVLSPQFLRTGAFVETVPRTPRVGQFAATFQGRIRVFFNALYTFCTYTATNEGADLIIDGEPVVDMSIKAVMVTSGLPPMMR